MSVREEQLARTPAPRPGPYLPQHKQQRFSCRNSGGQPAFPRRPRPPLGLARRGRGSPLRGGGSGSRAAHTRCAPPCGASAEPAASGGGSVSCSSLLSLQLADFNKENIAGCFPCAFKLETCLVPAVPLRAGRSKYGRARRRGRWGSVLPEEGGGRLAALSRGRRGGLRPGLGGGHSASAGARRAAVPGARRGPGGRRCQVSPPGPAPSVGRRAPGRLRGGQLQRAGGEGAGCREGGAAGSQRRWRRCSRGLQASRGCAGWSGALRPGARVSARGPAPSPAPRPGPPEAVGGPFGATRTGRAGRASLRFACAERLSGARLAGRSCEGPALASGGPSASGRVS